MADELLASRPQAAARAENRLLAALPPEELSLISGDLRTISLRQRDVLYRRGDPLEFVYFPRTGVYSVTTTLQDGTTIESLMVGREGALGLQAMLSETPRSDSDTVLQIGDGLADRMGTTACRNWLRTRPALRAAADRYLHATFIVLMQSIACNAHHAALQRCCRWLLMTEDRVERSHFPLSQEFLATMLGLRRQTVSAIAHGMQSAGWLRYTHGYIEIINRPALERSACECYRIVSDAYRAL